jgi:DNA uptake protein ComE-like DNA-binding protein
MLARDGQTFGPFDAGTVEAMLTAGQVDPAAAFAWTEGMPAWLPFRQVPALALLEPSAAAPAPPPPPPFAAPPPPPPPAASSAIAPPTASPVDDGKVDVNRAAEDDLLSLPGITLERARRMLDERARGGAFAGAAELGAFLGLAPHEVQALAAEASFGPVATQTPAPQPSAPAGRVVDF